MRNPFTFPCARSLIAMIIMLLVIPVSALPNTWECLGPDGGSFIGVVTDPSNADHVTAITSFPSAARAFRSSDGGVTWTQVGKIPYDSSLRDFAAFDPTRLYAINVYECYYSADGGVNWSLGSFPSGAGFGYCICVHPTNPDKVFVAGYRPQSADLKLFTSVDGAQSWISTTISPDFTMPFDITVSKSNPDVMYICGYKYLSGVTLGAALFKSSDGGATWADISSAVDLDPDQRIFSVAVDPINDNNVYAAGYRFYRSTDGGVSWTKDTSIDYYVESMAVDPVNPANVYMGGIDCVYVSNDYGQTWTTHTGSVKGYNKHVEVAPASPSTVYVTGSQSGKTLGGLFKSVDTGTTWNPSHTGLHACSIPSLAVSPLQPETVLMDLQEISTLMASYNCGDDWEYLTYPQGCGGTLNDLLISTGNPDTIIGLEEG